MAVERRLRKNRSRRVFINKIRRNEKKLLDAVKTFEARKGLGKGNVFRSCFHAIRWIKELAIKSSVETDDSEPFLW